MVDFVLSLASLVLSFLVRSLQLGSQVVVRPKNQLVGSPRLQTTGE